MTWSYDDTEPTDRDQVRGMIGDTNTKDQLLSNELIASVLVSSGSVISAALTCARRLRAKWMRDVDRSAIGISTSRSQKLTHLTDLIADLERQLLVTTPVPYVGAMNASEVAQLRGDASAVRPAFEVGQDDKPLSGTAAATSQGDLLGCYP